MNGLGGHAADGRRTLRLASWILLVAAGVWLRVLVSTLGANYDFGSYVWVSDYVLGGGNPYLVSDRYNYAPGWFLILSALRRIQLAVDPANLVLFHAMIAAFLALADVALAAVVAIGFEAGLAGAALVLLSPVSILISGFHTQFDVVAIVPALIAVLLLRRPGGGRLAAATALFGLSLVLKHVALLLPIVVLLDERHGSLRRRFAFCAGGGAIFAASFLPWAGGGGAAKIVERVFGYSPVHDGALLPTLLSPLLPPGGVAVAAKLALLLGIAATALLARRLAPRFVLPVYLAALFGFSPAIADQYLAVPVATTSVFRRRIAAMVLLGVSTIVVLASPHNVGSLPALAPLRPFVAWAGHGLAQLVALALLVALAIRPGRDAPEGFPDSPPPAEAGRGAGT